MLTELSDGSVEGGASEFLVKSVVSELGFVCAHYSEGFNSGRVSFEDLKLAMKLPR